MAFSYVMLFFCIPFQNHANITDNFNKICENKITTTIVPSGARNFEGGHFQGRVDGHPKSFSDPNVSFDLSATAIKTQCHNQRSHPLRLTNWRNLL
jgi:hypothetical protein